MLEILVTCILLSACLYGSTHWNLPLIHLIVRIVSGDHYEILRGWKGGPWSLDLLGGPKLEEVPDLKGGASEPSSYHAAGSKSKENQFCLGP